MSDPTAVFSIYDDRDREIRAVVQEVYDALKEKGYNPINQLVGYILSEDPTYITTYKNARSLIRRVPRDDLLGALLRISVPPSSSNRVPPRAGAVFFFFARALQAPGFLLYYKLYYCVRKQEDFRRAKVRCLVWRLCAFCTAWPVWPTAATKA